jgi:hypothetical protein
MKMNTLMMVFAFFADEGSSSAEDAMVLSVIREAQAEFQASTHSGRISFSRRIDNPDTGMLRESNGMLEWDEDYVYFDGTTKWTTPGKEKGTFSLHMDDRVRFYRDDRNVAAWILRTPREGVEHGVKSLLTLLPIAQFPKSGLHTSMPDPELMMRTRDGFRSDFGLELVQEKPVTRKGNPMVRTLSVNDSTVTLKAVFPQRIEVTADFNLKKDCMCIRDSVVHRYVDPPRFESMERTFEKSDDGRWYPASTRAEIRSGSTNGKLTFVGVTTIQRYEPLGKRRITAEPGINIFGPLPDGTDIQTIDAQGKLRHSLVGNRKKADEEDLLLMQSGQLKKKGLGSDKRAED